MNTAKLGDEFIDEVINEIKDTGVEIKKTKGSGNVHGDGDVIISLHNGNRISIDGKYTGKPKTSKEMDKINKQAITSGYDGGILARNYIDEFGNENIKVEMTIDTLINITSTIDFV